MLTPDRLQREGPSQANEAIAGARWDRTDGLTDETLESLAVRCEAATGPDRELDSLIGEAVGLTFRSRRTAGGKNKGREWLVDSHGGVESWSHHAPAHTASLDAAKSLYPKLPELIPSNPRLATAAALRARAKGE